MDHHVTLQAKFLYVAILGLVGLILVLVHTFAAFSPSLEDGFWDKRSPIAGPVSVIEFLWSSITLVTSVVAASGRAGPAILTGLLAVVVSLLFLLVGGGARNWPAGTLLVFVMFWGAFVLELGLGFGRRLLDRHVSSAAGAVGPADPDRWARWAGDAPSHHHDPEAAQFGATASQAKDAAQGPPPYENSPLLPGPEDAAPLLARGGTPETSAKPVGE